MRRLLTVLRAIPRTTIVESGHDAVRVEFRTRIFRFDVRLNGRAVELVKPPTQVK